MKRKSFIKSLSLGAAASYLLPSNLLLGMYSGKEKSNKWLKTKHETNKYNTTIHCNKVERNIKFLHISDSHISVLKNGKSEYPEFTGRMDSAYQNPKHYLTNIENSKVAHFEEILKVAKNKNVDFILLTGDIINNPSIYNVEYLDEKLKQTGIEYFYTAGNHDWHFEGMKGSLHELREEWITKRLLPLYKGNNPLYYSKIIAGINFIFIDNSTYQISKEQLAFFREQTELEYPIVLNMHIPIYQSEDKYNEELYTIGDPRWGYEFDYENYITERRERWSKEGNKKETLEFIIDVLLCKNLIAVLAGHNHAAMNKKISPSANMYLTRASYSGAHGYFEIVK